MTKREKELATLLKEARDKISYMVYYGEWYAPEALIDKIDDALQIQNFDVVQQNILEMKEHIEQLDISLGLLENITKRSRARINAVLGKE